MFAAFLNSHSTESATRGFDYVPKPPPKPDKLAGYYVLDIPIHLYLPDRCASMAVAMYVCDKVRMDLARVAAWYAGTSRGMYSENIPEPSPTYKNWTVYK